MAVGQLLLDADDFVTAIPAAKRLKLLNYVAAAVVGIHVRDGARAPRALPRALPPSSHAHAGRRADGA